MKKVFFIMPFSDDFIDLYEKIKTEFCADFVFNNAGDLDNQQSIIQDIVEGIYSADIIIADLTGLNPNVFYELGLAHAMNKNVIIITQNISELPFDIKSYRANEYSMKFNKMPDLINKLRDLLNRSMTDSTKFGNPVTDYIPNYKVNNIDDNNFNNNESDSVEFDESGIVDYTEDIIENASTMKEELNNIGKELTDLVKNVDEVSKEVDRVKEQSGNVDISYTKKICRRLSTPIDEFSKKLRNHVLTITSNWNNIENDFLSIFDNKLIQDSGILNKLDEELCELSTINTNIDSSNTKVEELINVLESCMGIERRLNKATNSLIEELESYLVMTDTIKSSVDRITSKGRMVIEDIK